MKKFAFLFVILFSIASASASTASANNWDITTNSSIHAITGEINQMVHDDTFVLKITTLQNSYCRYSESSENSFSEMTSGFFDDNLERTHKKTFTGFTSSTVKRYYVKCIDIGYRYNSTSYPEPNTQLEIIVTIDPSIAAKISIDKDYLSAGEHEVKVETTKIPLGIPTLTYSFDGISKTPITLTGSGTSWKGYITIPKSSGEKIGTFEFSARDLEGITGTKIILSDGIFKVDTSAPFSITSLEATGEYKQIKLEWFSSDDDIKKINIYRSTNPNVGKNDFYKEVSPKDNNYIDKDIAKSKTYYYRISPMDSAGNVADLSIEVSAAMRLDNHTSPTGLSPKLIHLVDSLLTEIDLLKSDIKSSLNSLNTKEDKDKDLLKLIGVQNSLENSNSELVALEKEVVSYKLQDLNQETLESRLASSRVRLNIINKKVPNIMLKTENLKKEIKITEDDIRNLLIEYLPELSPSKIDKTIKNSMKLMKENELKLISEIDVFEITYLDGTKSSSTIVTHQISSVLERSGEAVLLLKIPMSIDAEEVKIKNLDYTEERKGLISFGTDTKNIVYTINKKIDSQILDEIIISAIQKPKEQSTITGNFLSEIPSSGIFGIIILALLASSLVLYLTVIKKKQFGDSITSFIEKAQEVKNLQKAGHAQEANRLYESLKIDYVKLSPTEKSKVFNKISHLHKK